ncbi:MAG: tetratricopeptide repeat protein [Candidatus Cloacimonadota bacterium]
MKKRVQLFTVIMLSLGLLMILSACSTMTRNPGLNQNSDNSGEAIGTVTKVAFLPIKALDSNSRYIKTILTKRDLALVFGDHPKYSLLDMREVERLYKESGHRDVEGLEPEEMQEVAQDLGADLLVIGNVSTVNASTFRLSVRLYSPRSQELKQANFNMVKDRETRFTTLNDTFMTEIDGFISGEVQKMYNLAQNAYILEKYTEAEASLNQVLGLDAQKKEAHFTLGQVYFRTQRYDLAVASLNRALEIDADYDQALNQLVEVYEAANQPIRRIETMARIAEKNRNAELWFNIGNLYAENGNNGQAVASFRKALEIEPEFALAQSRLAFMLYDQGNYAEAIEYLEFAANQYPDNDLISRRLALAYQRSGRIDDAITRYEAAIASNPQSVQAYLNVVSLYRIKASEDGSPAVTQEMNRKAIELMNRLKTAAPDNALAYLNLASIYLAQNDNTNAETNANTALTKDPTLYLPYVILSTISQTRGTEAYNRFADLEQRASRAVGRTATNLRRDRDAAKAQANTQFRRALDQLQSARSRTTDTEIINDLNTRISRVQTLISQTSGL